jgi:hypothetical protein
MTGEMVVTPEDVQEGDLILEIGSNTVVMAPYAWGGEVVAKDHPFANPTKLREMAKATHIGWKFKVRRSGLVLVTTKPMYQGTVSLGPAKRTIPDWPLRCPKCARDASAVLLFMGYDCKHGCYK